MIYKLTVECLTPVLVGSGEGFGALIDTDVVFDDVGLPYIPAKRIKGCLLDAAKDVQDMFQFADIAVTIALPGTFGKPGAEKAAPIYFSNLMLEKHQEHHAWLQYYLHLFDPAFPDNGPKYQHVLSRERILATFTEIRQQTEIKDHTGVAEDHSLRTIRVLRKHLRFVGDVALDDTATGVLTTLLLACANFRQMGAKRNRGFGEVRCVLGDENGQELHIPTEVNNACQR